MKLFATAALTLLATSLPAQHPNYPANIARQVAKVHAANAHAPAGKATPFAPTWDSLAQYRSPAWFSDAKFGIFLHWGVYSVPAFGNEWYSRNMYVPGNKAFDHHIATYGPQSKFGYKDFIRMFKAEHFDPNAWVDLFAQAGARYVVPVAEHCDGFAMYASDITPWNAAQMGPHRDVVGELAQATRAHGLHFGVSSHTAEHWWWYGLGRTFPSDVREAIDHPAQNPLTAQLYGPAGSMSLPGPGQELNKMSGDAAEPNPSHLELWLPPDQPWLDNWLARNTELVDKYHPDFLYFDWWIGQPAYKPALQQFAAYYYNDAARRNAPQPVLTYKQEDFPPNAATLDIERGKLDAQRLLPWQTDTSISVHSWGYAEHDEYRTAPSLLQQLVDAVSKNGNLLLNVGPKSDGTIPEEARTVLLQIGAWLKVNGEAIYNTRPFTVFGEGPTVAPKDPTAKNRDIQTYTPQDIRYTVASKSLGINKLSADPKHPGAPCIAASPRCVGSSDSSAPSDIYATAMSWPTSGSLTMHVLFTKNPYLPAPVCAVTLLGSGNGATSKIPFTQSPDGLHLTLPATPPESINPANPAVFHLQTTCT